MPLKKVNYLQFLKSCWDEHLSPRDENAPTVISTFAGAGGSSLGYSMAGFRELLAVELDNNAVDIFQLNFPTVPVYHGDIKNLGIDDVLKITNLDVGELDVLDGSPPCQGFSVAGRRQLDDPRNGLYLEYIRLLRGLSPKVFVMENVSGMIKGGMKLLFGEIIRELKKSGYKVSAKLLNTKYFNVPQSRERLIFIGVREDLDILPSHPAAESIPITVREAFQDVNIGVSDGYFTGERLLFAKNIPQYGSGADVITNYGFNFRRLAYDKPSRTIIKTVGSPGSKFGSGLIHPVEDRHLGIGELKRIGSFPDEFEFIGSFKEQWARIGNSVPPLFMRSIALHIRKSILCTNIGLAPEPAE